MTVKIKGMMCGHCEKRVYETLSAIDGIASCEVSHKKNRAEIKLKEGAAVNDIKEKIVSEIEKAGYFVVGFKE